MPEVYNYLQLPTATVPASASKIGLTLAAPITIAQQTGKQGDKQQNGKVRFAGTPRPRIITTPRPSESSSKVSNTSFAGSTPHPSNSNTNMAGSTPHPSSKERVEGETVSSDSQQSEPRPTVAHTFGIPNRIANKYSASAAKEAAARAESSAGKPVRVPAKRGPITQVCSQLCLASFAT